MSLTRYQSAMRALDRRATSRPLIYHPPMDYSVTTLEAETIPFESGRGFMADLRSDMGSSSTAYLAAHYPELVFTFAAGKKRPAGYDVVEKCSRGFMAARWRTA